MGIRYNSDESYSSWAERVQKHEYNIAIKRIKNGEDAYLVLEDMSKNISKKMLHPVIKEISNVDIPKYDAEEGRKKYEERMKEHKPIADHIDKDT